MDFAKIKNLVKQSGDKFIFLEDGEPEVVMMSFGEYQKMMKSGPDFAERINNFEMELAAPPLAETRGLPVRLEDIRLEDLPV